MKKLLSILTTAAMMTSMAAVPTWAVEYGTLTLDTQSYTMAPGDIYDFRAKVEGGDLSQDEVTVSDSRTGSVVKLSRVAGTDKYRITAVNEGTCYVVADIRGTHASIRVDVKKGVEQGGVAAKSVTQVPVSSSGTSSGSVTAIDIVPDSVKNPSSQQGTADDPLVTGPQKVVESVPNGINEEYAQEIFDLTNEEREKAGLEPLEWNDDLTEPAQIRAEEVTVKFSHDRPNNDPYEFYFMGAHAEIVTGAISAEDAIDRWMASDDHRAIMLNERFRSVAVGCYVVNGSLYCVELLSSNEV